MKGKEFKFKNRHSWLVKLMTFVTVLATAYSLILPAVTVSATETYCNMEEHVHSEECDENCAIPEHIHTLQCESNPNADLEDASVWTASFGAAASMAPSSEKLAAIAASQVGYQESQTNFTVLEDGTKASYSRYGQWAGVPYDSNWSADFINFCLANAGASGVIGAMSDASYWYATAMSSQVLKEDPQQLRAGDIVFFDQGGVLAAGIATQVSEAAVTVASKTGPAVTQTTLNKASLSQMAYSAFPAEETAIAQAEEKAAASEEKSEGVSEEQKKETEAPKASVQNTPAVLTAAEDCDFASQFPKTVITREELMYKNPGMTNWEPYTDQTLTDQSQLSIQVFYENLAKEDVLASEVNGKYYYEIPQILKSTDNAVSGSVLLHTNQNGEQKEEITLGALKSCPADPNHVHIDMYNANLVSGTQIKEGKFAVGTAIDLNEYLNGADPVVTIGGKKYELKIDPYSMVSAGKVNNFQKDKDPVGGNNIERLEDGRIRLSYQITFLTGNTPFVDAVIDDWMNYNREVTAYEPESLTIQAGEAASEKVAGNEKYKLVVNPQQGLPVAEGEGYTIGESLSYTDFNEVTKTHAVPGPGFSVYLGTLQANTTYKLRYTVIADTTRMIGGERNFRNEAKVFSDEIEKGSDYEDTPISSYLNVNKTAGQGTLDNKKGDMLIPFTVTVKANDGNSYAFLDVTVDDLLKIQSTSGTDLSGYINCVEVVASSLKVLKGQAASENQLTDVNRIEAQLSEKTETATSGKYSINIGTMNPGDVALITYQVKISKELREKMAINSVDDVSLFNEATITRTSSSYPDENYTVNSSTHTAMKGTGLAEKQQVTEIQQVSGTISTAGHIVYGTDKNPESISEFTVPAGSVGYEIQLNEFNAANVYNAQFTDSLSQNGSKQSEFGYTGYVQIKIFNGAQSEDNKPADIIFVKLPEGADSYTFAPKDYARITELNAARPEGTNLSFQLKYYVKPIGGSEKGIMLTNEISGTGIGVGSGGVPIQITRKVTGWTASSGNTSLKKVGLCVVEPEIPENGYPNGKLIWLIQINSSVIPKGFVLHDQLRNTPMVPGNTDAISAPYYLDNAVIGVFKTTEKFDQAPFTSFDALSTTQQNRDPDIYEKVMNRLNGSQIETDQYSVTFGSPAVNDHPNSFDLSFNKDISLDEGEVVYVAVQAGFSVNNNRFWHYNQEKSNAEASNQASFRLGDQDLQGQVTANLAIRNYWLIRKDWGEVFSWENDTFKYLDRNTNTKIASFTEHSVMAPILQQQGERLKLKDRTVYLDWRIGYNAISDANNSNDRHQYSGTFDFVDELSVHQKYAGCFITKDSGSSVTLLEKPTIENVEVVQNTNGLEQIRVRVSGIENPDDFTLHVIAECTISRDTILSTNGYYTLPNKVSLYRNNNMLGYAEDSKRVEEMDILSKTKLTNLAPGETLTNTQMKFQIKVNPDNLDIMQNSDSISLTDTFNSKVLTINPDTIVVTNLTGTPITGYRISFSDPDENGQQTMTIDDLPDETGLIVTYIADINALPGQQVPISNTASWEGKGKPAPTRTFTENFTYSASGSSSSASSEQLKVKKIDQDNAAVKLSGASFKAEKMNIEDLSVAEEIGTFTTDELGSFTISTNLMYNTLYRLVETKAPNGYELDETPHYFYFEKSDAADYTRPTNLPEQNISLCEHGQTLEIQIMNHKPRFSISVLKSFGDAHNAIPGTYTFGLYTREYTEGMLPDKTAVLQVPDNATEQVCTTAFEGLTEKQTYYIYELDPETSLPIQGGEKLVTETQRFIVTYPDGNVVNASADQEDGYSVKVVNSPVYQLPETGGIGDLPYLFTGAAISAGAVLYMIDRKKRSNKK